MPNYKEWAESRLLDERNSVMMRLEREQREVAKIDEALAIVRSSNGNGGEPKRGNNSANYSADG